MNYKGTLGKHGIFKLKQFYLIWIIVVMNTFQYRSIFILDHDFLLQVEIFSAFCYHCTHILPQTRLIQ